MEKDRGLLFAVYGPNNLGKTTLVRGIKTYFDLFCPQITCTTLKYPRYDTPTGERINDYLRHGNPENLTYLQAQTLFAQDRRINQPHLEELIRRYHLVGLEDYSGTGISWGVYFGINRSVLEELNGDLLKPDLSLLVDGQRFSQGIESGHLHENQGNDGWVRNRSVHLESAQLYHWSIVNANQSKKEVLRSALDIILPAINSGQLPSPRPVF